MSAPSSPSNSLAAGVGHEEEALSDVRSAEARSAEIERPEGVARSFQVSLNSVEPSKSVLGRNLLAKDDVRGVGSNEAEELGPQVTVVSGAGALACRAEGLAGARSCPNRSGVVPTGST